MRTMLKSKIHRARITEVDIDYEGSITIDKALMEKADILRFVTYAIEGEKGEICINGAAARLVAKGDTIIILSFCQVEEEKARNFKPTLVYVDDKNAITKIK